MKMGQCLSMEGNKSGADLVSLMTMEEDMEPLLTKKLCGVVEKEAGSEQNISISVAGPTSWALGEQ